MMKLKAIVATAICVSSVILFPLREAIAEVGLDIKNTTFLDSVFRALGDEADIRLTNFYLKRGWEYCQLRSQGHSDGEIIVNQINEIQDSSLSPSQKSTFILFDSVVRSAARENLCREFLIDD